jgi:hypothetical protein
MKIFIFFKQSLKSKLYIVLYCSILFLISNTLLVYFDYNYGYYMLIPLIAAAYPIFILVKMILYAIINPIKSIKKRSKN